MKHPYFKHFSFIFLFILHTQNFVVAGTCPPNSTQSFLTKILTAAEIKPREWIAKVLAGGKIKKFKLDPFLSAREELAPLFKDSLPILDQSASLEKRMAWIDLALAKNELHKLSYHPKAPYQMKSTIESIMASDDVITKQRLITWMDRYFDTHKKFDRKSFWGFSKMTEKRLNLAANDLAFILNDVRLNVSELNDLGIKGLDQKFTETEYFGKVIHDGFKTTLGPATNVKKKSIWDHFRGRPGANVSNAFWNTITIPNMLQGISLEAIPFLHPTRYLKTSAKELELMQAAQVAATKTDDVALVEKELIKQIEAHANDAPPTDIPPLHPLEVKQALENGLKNELPKIIERRQKIRKFTIPSQVAYNAYARTLDLVALYFMGELGYMIIQPHAKNAYDRAFPTPTPPPTAEELEMIRAEKERKIQIEKDVDRMLDSIDAEKAKRTIKDSLQPNPHKK